MVPMLSLKKTAANESLRRSYRNNKTRYCTLRTSCCVVPSCCFYPVKSTSVYERQG